MPLSDAQIRNARPAEMRVLKLSDGEGLQLWGKPSGAKLWNLAYRFDGKQRTLAIGPYPRVSLKDARTRRDEAKRQFDVGADPCQQKRLAKLASAAQQANTFGSIAGELLELKRREGKVPATLKKFVLIYTSPSARLTSGQVRPSALPLQAPRERLNSTRRLNSSRGRCPS